MRLEELYLADIIEAVDAIRDFAATKDVPELRHMVAEILSSEYPEQR